MKPGKLLVHCFRKTRNALGVKTYQLEMIIVAIILIAVAVISKKGRIERVGVIAVFLTFGHAGVADRLEEAERHRQKEKEKNDEKDKHGVWCYYKLQRYYYAKEICRTIYFIALGARSALAGVIIFLLYTPRRKLYRKYYPLHKEEKMPQ